MKPYYEHAGITIYHGDCMDVLPVLGMSDLLLTDPPYGICKSGRKISPAQKRFTGKHGGRRAYDFYGWDKERPPVKVIHAALAAANHHVIWGGNYFSDMLPATSGWIVWDKGQRISQSDGELAWTSESSGLRIYTINRAELLRDKAAHPTQKPLPLIRQCLCLFPEARTVIDPFMGSGTTLVAAKQLGRTAVGIDIIEAYCEIAAKRLAQEQLF